MAKKLKGYKPPARRGSASAFWAQFADGSWWRVSVSESRCKDVMALTHAAYQWAHRHGFKSNVIREQEAVVVRFTKREESTDGT